MIFIGLLCGAFLGKLLDGDGWMFGAAVGTVIGWLIGRVNSLSKQLQQMQGVRSALPEPAAAATAAPPGTERPATMPDADIRTAALPEAIQPPDVARPVETLSPLAGSAAPALESAASPARIAPVAPSRNLVMQWILGGNTVVRVGIIILFVGVAFLLKFAYDHSHLSIQLRLIGAALGALVLLVLGWRLRLRKPPYALTLQGGGVGLLYLTIFAAFRIFSVIPAGPAFALLVLLTGFAALLAILQDSLALAIAGVAGGFLAPVLISTGNGSHVALFTYDLILNLGIVGVAWKKAWRVLNLLGFAFTFGIGLTWGEQYYQADYLASTEPFLILFFLLYIAIPILFARHRVGTTKPYVDGTLVIGVPIAAFGLQTAMVHLIPYATALSAVALGTFYLLVASILWRRAGARERLLSEAFLALGCGFATLAIPLAFDGRTTSAAWAVEGAGAVWLGLRQRRLLSRLSGYALQVAGAVSFVIAFDTTSADSLVLNSRYLGCILIALGGWFTSMYATREKEKLTHFEQAIPALGMLWGGVWWVGGGLDEAVRHVGHEYQLHALLLYLTTTAISLSVLSRRLSWPVARWGAYALVPVMCLALSAEFDGPTHAFAAFGYIVWPITIAAYLWILRRAEGQDGDIIDALHTAALWIVTTLLSWELWWQAGQFVGASSDWRPASLIIVPIIFIWALTSHTVQCRWPVSPHRRSYFVWSATGIAAYLLMWTFGVNLTSPGNASPIKFIPLFNPLDISIALTFLTLIHWYLRLRADTLGRALRDNAIVFYVTMGAATFTWINAIALRTVHHWARVPFQFDVMWHSVVVQATLSLLWSFIALVSMAVATRKALRPLWMAGASLMGVVVVKLVGIDLSNVGGIERIVSFIGVGILMLVIGYVAPVPPRTRPVAQEPQT